MNMTLIHQIPMDSTTMTLVVTGAGVIISGLISFLVASMQIGAYKNKVDRAGTDITEIKAENKEIRDKVIACETSLKEREPLTKRKSPISLTERGLKVLTDSKGKDFVDENYNDLKEKVEEMSPQTSYDIQEASREVVSSLGDDTRINPIKEYLFKEGMELEDITGVLGIYLRDKILSERGVDVNDIDKYDPSRQQQK